MIPVATTEESGVHHAPRFGFWISGDETRDQGTPPERRPLTRRGIRNWTIGSLVGSALFAAVVAVALSQDDAYDARTSTVQTRPDAVPAQAAAAPPATTPPIPIIPLEALPIAKDGPPKTARAAKRRTHNAVAPPHASIAQKTFTPRAVESSSRALGPSRAKAMAANGKSASAR
jgi:hypothetical protein